MRELKEITLTPLFPAGQSINQYKYFMNLQICISLVSSAHAATRLAHRQGSGSHFQSRQADVAWDRTEVWDDSACAGSPVSARQVGAADSPHECPGSEAL